MKNSIDFLFSPEAIRERTGKVYEKALAGETSFKINLDKLDDAASYVADVIKENYPKLDIPFHSRWGHFRVGKIDRVAKMEQDFSSDPIEKARQKLDLAITSVLLDAGAGPSWKFFEKETEKSFNRSEGLGVASFYLFKNGQLANDGSLKADGKKLQEFSVEDLKTGFQVSEENPLVGLEGRVSLINSLGKVISKNKGFFKDGRPGNIVDYLIDNHGKSFEAADVFKAVLNGFGNIWPSRLTLEDRNLGDIWEYSGMGSDEFYDRLVPFHKLSGWLTYSLLEPMMEAGIEICGVEKLTGLAEYRNGGFFLDFGLIELRDRSNLEKAHLPSSDLIIEWRALTIQLLDKIAGPIRSILGKSEVDFPLAKVLEGGTWWAGRKIAASKRSDSSPPLKLDSDGTVF